MLGILDCHSESRDAWLICYFVEDFLLSFERPGWLTTPWYSFFHMIVGRCHVLLRIDPTNNKIVVLCSFTFKKQYFLWSSEASCEVELSLFSDTVFCQPCSIFPSTNSLAWDAFPFSGVPVSLFQQRFEVFIVKFFQPSGKGYSKVLYCLW